MLHGLNAFQRQLAILPSSLSPQPDDQTSPHCRYPEVPKNMQSLFVAVSLRMTSFRMRNQIEALNKKLTMEFIIDPESSRNLHKGR